jgi:uncharacterized protein
MLNMIKITTEKQEILKKIADRYDIKLMALFGSQVSGKIHKESDFDIAYLADKKLSFEDEGRIIIDLAKIIGTRDERLVNLSDIKNAGVLLLKEIFDRHQILFCADRNVYDSYKIFSVKNFIENRPIFDLRDYLIEKYFAKYAQ